MLRVCPVHGHRPSALFFSWCAAFSVTPHLLPLRTSSSASSIFFVPSFHHLDTFSVQRYSDDVAPSTRPLRQAALARTSLRSFTSTSLASSSSSSATSSDPRPPSSRIFTPDEVSAGMKALAAAGYDSSSIWEQRVCWGDHDQFQHVNNVHFVRWFESSRMFFTQILTANYPKKDKMKSLRARGKVLFWPVST